STMFNRGRFSSKPCCLTASCYSPLFSIMIPRPPTCPLFPYTTLFRSGQNAIRQAMQVSRGERKKALPHAWWRAGIRCPARQQERSEEHTSELQSLRHLVCRLLLEKKKKSKSTSASLISNGSHNEATSL